MLIILFLAISIILNARDSIFYKNDEGEFYRLISPDSYDANGAVEKTYYIYGQIKSEKHYSDYKKKILTGKVK